MDEPLADDEIIIRRLLSPYPGSPETTTDRPGIGQTATSFSLKPRPEEDFPSWSRKAVTSPRQLVELAVGCDTRGACVCEITVGAVRQFGLDVRRKPTAEDPGHCEITPTPIQNFTDKIWSKIAKQSLVIYTHAAE